MRSFEREKSESRALCCSDHPIFRQKAAGFKIFTTKGSFFASESSLFFCRSLTSKGAEFFSIVMDQKEGKKLNFSNKFWKFCVNPLLQPVMRQTLMTLNSLISYQLPKMLAEEGHFRKNALGCQQFFPDSTAPALHVVDIFSAFDAATHLYDGLHPNEMGDRVIATKWFEVE